MRILYLPFFELVRPLKAQKRGLREAFATRGRVLQIHYRREFYRHGREGALHSVSQALNELHPHFVLSQLHGADVFSAEDILSLRKLIPHGTWANWNGDYRDPATWREADIELARTFDVQLVVCHDAVREYEKRGIRSRYWQIGWEPHGVGKEPTRWTRRHGLLFQANCYSEKRLALVEAIRKRQFRLGLYGKGWPLFWAKGSTLYDYRKGCRLIRAAKIVLGDNQWPSADGFVSNRLFQSLAAGGAIVVQQYFKGYEKLGLVDGEHLVIWNDVADLIEKVEYWLRPENEEPRAAIAAAGQKFCLENHSFDVRVQELFQILAELHQSNKSRIATPVFSTNLVDMIRWPLLK